MHINTNLDHKLLEVLDIKMEQRDHRATAKLAIPLGSNFIGVDLIDFDDQPRLLFFLPFEIVFQ